jgi:hypothetical protein
MLSKAMGYTGEARFVSFQWTAYGDEAVYSDGRLSANANWEAFLAYILHPAVYPSLQDYDLGSSEREAEHVLILDREKLEVLIAPAKDAQTFLAEQWPPLRLSHQEQLAAISKALKNVKQPEDIDIEEIQRRIDEQYDLVEAMELWLDRLLKN